MKKEPCKFKRHPSDPWTTGVCFGPVLDDESELVVALPESEDLIILHKSFVILESERNRCSWRTKFIA